MKIIFPAIILICFLFAACNKENISIKQSESFIKFYGGKMDDIGIQVLAVNDGGFIIMGNIEVPNRGKDICFIRTDKFGNSLSPVKVYGGLFDDYGYAIRKTTTGYVIAGSTEQFNGAKKDILLIQVDEQGNELKRSVMGTSRNDESYDIQVLENGNFIMTGYSDSIETSKKEMMLAVANQNGDLLSMNLIGYKEDDEVGYSIIASDTETYYTAGYSKSRPFNTTKSNIFIVKWVTKGEGHNIPIPLINESDGNSSAVSIIAGGDGNFIVSCNNIQLSQSNITRIKLLNIDKDLNIIWQKNYGERVNSFVSCTYIHDGKIYIICTSGGNTDQYGDVLLIEAGVNGEGPVYYYTGDGNSYSGKSLDFTADGGYIITGANKTNETSVIALIKLNPEHQL